MALTILGKEVKILRRNTAPWRANSQLGETLFDTEPLTPELVAARQEEMTHAAKRGKRHTIINGYLSYEDQRVESPGALIHNGRRTAELEQLIRSQGLTWKRQLRSLAAEGVPTATGGFYTGPGAIANAQALTAVTGGVANVLWWAPLTYTPFPGANGLKTPAAYRLTASGLVTSSAAGQTITMNAAVGTAAGTNLGSSTALALGSTITNAFWRLAVDLVIRTGGTSSTSVAGALMHWGTTAGASATVSNALFGGGNTVATVDIVTAAQALAIGATPSAAGVSVTPTILQWASWD